MHIDVFERDRSLILKVHGDVDVATAPTLDQQLERAAQSTATFIVVDLGEVGFIDSSGLHVLLRHAARASQNGGRLRLTRASPQAQQLFRLTGTIDHLPIIDA